MASFVHLIIKYFINKSFIEGVIREFISTRASLKLLKDYNDIQLSYKEHTHLESVYIYSYM